MLKTLKYHVTFASTGTSLAEEISFETGFGAITGPNEAGKSFVVEMVRYALFGTAALRGKSEDYKTLTVDLSFLVKGATYTVLRGSKSWLARGGEEIALGTRSVNAKIIELLGFSLDVFDVACIANQGDVERLGAMKPAERKKMVDSVIGLGVIDDLAGWAGETALELGREAETIERVTVKPVEPSSPQDYVASAVLEEEITALEALNREYLQLKGVVTIERQAPQRPLTMIEEPAEVLKSLAAEQARSIARLLISGYAAGWFGGAREASAPPATTTTEQPAPAQPSTTDQGTTTTQPSTTQP